MLGVGARLGVCLVVAAAWLVPFGARAQSSLAVLGFVSEEGDDELADSLTRALRSEAAAGDAFTVSTTTASMAQMTMAQDCELSEAACRQAIGSALGTEQVMYGTLRRAGSRGHTVEAHLFGSGSGEETAATRTIASGTVGAEALAPTARELLRALTAPEAAAPQAASVPVEEAPAVPTVAPAVTPLEDVEGREQDVPPPEPESATSNDWLGYTLVGVAVASLGATAFAWIQIDQANEDVDLRAYRTAVPSTVDDACAELDAGNAHGLSASTLSNADDACSQGKTFDVLQYVFLATAIVSGGVGVYFLLDDESEPARAAGRSRSIALSPQVSPHGARLTARVAF